MKRIIAISACVFAICAFASGVAIAEENRHVRIINHASSPIENLYASNVDSDSWEEDLLGLFQFISPNHYLDANIDDGTGHCLYDIKAVLVDGRVATTRGFNVCTNSTWTVTDGK